MAKYKYSIDEDIARIYLIDKNGVEHEVLIDASHLERFINFKYKWNLMYYKKISWYYVGATEYLGMHDGKPKYRTVLLHKYLTNVQGRTLVDHINRNTLDNRLLNLRPVDTSTNSKNRSGANRNSTTGVRNVSYSKTSGQYIVQLQVDGKNTVFGRFDNLKDARVVAEEKRLEIYGVK